MFVPKKRLYVAAFLQIKIYMLKNKIHFALWIVLATAACSSPQYRYVPVSDRAGAGKNHSEAVYSIPEGLSEGTVKISSNGVVDLKSKTDSKQFPTIHIHMSISNMSNLPWTVAAKDQVIAFPDQGQSSPVFANSNAETLPTVTIPPGALRIVELYFELPQIDKSAEDVPEFDFRWAVRTASAMVNNSTPFDRVAIRERHVVAVYPYDPYYMGVGVNTVWWGRPGWGWRR